MINIPGYTLSEKINETRDMVVYRGYADSDDQKKSCVFKIFKKIILPPADLVKIRLEMDGIKKIKSNNIVRLYEMIDYNDRIIIVLEDFQGVPLNVFQNEKPIDLETFLKIAIQLSDALSDFHRHDIIHNNIRPTVIFINEGTGIVKLGDFGILSEITKPNESFYDSEVIKNRLPYISPEQTGRMNRTIDYRTDFYSLGITLYEMLTSRLPFQSDDPMEIIHGHIAKIAVSPSEINKEIPSVISDIIMKLLSKNAEERYLSGYGLKSDLQKCLEQLEKNVNMENFAIGMQDISDRFQIPQKLYGREEEIRILITAFDRVSKGAVEMMLVSGEPGIGKTVLVHEIHKPVVQHRGYFVSGKYDQLRKDVPYRAIIQAIKQLLIQILTESEEKIQLWKERLTDALGVNGQVIIDVIPGLELIIGKQPSVSQLGPTESQNRFNNVFQRFIRVFAKKEHPLVIFLDDMQWVDLASLDLIRTLVTDYQMKYLLIIFGYRDTEVSSSHPFILTLDEIIKADVLINQIKLFPLKAIYVNHLIADAMNCSLEKAESLSSLVYLKTQGNPFFVKQFLNTLYRENMLFLDSDMNWHCDIEKIKHLEVTENVVALMLRRINMLSQQTQDLLRIASCFGNRFELETLAMLYGKPVIDTYISLDEAAKEDLVILSEGKYQFIHDRVYEAAYSLNSDTDKEQLHYKIGDLELKRTKKEELMDKIFYIVDQLNLGSRLITDKTEKQELAKMNFMAGEKAKASNAFASAARYLAAGMDLLDKDCWQSQYGLASSLYIERAECEYLIGGFEEAERLFDIILKNIKTDRERAEVFRIKSLLYHSKGKYKDAFKYGIKGLDLLGFKMPRVSNKLAILLEVLKCRFYIGRKKPNDLLYLPEMTSQKKKEVISFITGFAPSAYLISQDLFSLLMFKVTSLSLRYGIMDKTSPSFALYGMIIGSFLGRFKSGYEFGLLAVELSKRFSDLSSQCETDFVIGGFINHWIKHVKTDISYLIQGFLTGIESGNFIYAGYCAGLHTAVMTFKGDCLDDVIEQCNKYLDSMKRIKHTDMIQAITGVRQAAHSLKGTTRSPYTYSNEDFDEDSYKQDLKNFASPFPACIYYTFKLPVLYICEDYARAIETATELQKMRGFILGLFHSAFHNFFYSLTLCALYPEAPKREKKRYWKTLRQNQKRMKKWADNCQENFLHKFLLVNAEMARIKGNDVEAMELYDKAIKLAIENGFIQEGAIAHELAANFYLSKGKESIARTYMIGARDCYSRWGADAKVKLLDERYSELLSDISEEAVITAEKQKLSVTSSALSILDVKTILESSQTISEEISLNRLLSKLMHIIIENAGAQKGLFILERDGKLFIEAESSIDRDEVTILKSIPVESRKDISSGILQYVRRTREVVVLDDAVNEGMFTSDHYITKNQSKSILCSPIIRQNKLIGILYLENNRITGAFTPERIEILNIFSSQAAISLENAMLYDDLDLRVQERTDELMQANKRLKNEIAERKRAEDQMARMAFYDPLTNLPNRVLFMERLKNAFERKKRDKDYLFAVFFMDLDRFKVINDSFGHMAGDQLLIMLAHRLKKITRAVNTVARLGGDEFGILIEDIKKISDIDVIVERIQNEFRLPFDLLGQEVFVAFSIGITTSETNLYVHPEDFLRDADIAMYNAKARGRACHVLFDPAMHTEAVSIGQIEADLRRAIQNNEFVFYYQPIISIETNKIIGFEALLRWHHPEGCILQPDEFILIAEQTELIIQIGKWALTEACRQMHQWQERFPACRHLTISVNLSDREFLHPDFVELVEKTLNETGLDGRSLRIEITERMIIENSEPVFAIVQRLKGLNIQFDIDDFGIGYSALSYLRHFPVSAIKIDKSFIHTLATDKYSTEIVRAIIVLAQRLDMKVIAEGMETEEQMALFKDMNGKYAQGYLFHRPMDNKAVEDLLSTDCF